MPSPKDPVRRQAWIEKIRAARSQQGATVPKGTKFSAEHRAKMSAGHRASAIHRSKNQSGANNSMWRGGWGLDKNGYVRCFRGGKEVMQHREVMEQHLGRKLESWEHVHHKDGDRSNNAISNLELWGVRRQPKGQRQEDMIDWAIAFLVRAGYTVSKASSEERARLGSADTVNETVN